METIINASFEEMEINGQLYNVVVEALYECLTEHYGADADGNRGITRDVVDCLEILSVVGEADGTLTKLNWLDISKDDYKKILAIMDDQAYEAYVQSKY